MKKICVICEICVTKKTSQEKSVYICEICGTFSNLRGYLFFVGLFLSHRFHRYTQIFYGISGESLCPISGGICNDRTGRLCEIPWVIVAAGNLRINSVASDDEKNLRHRRNLRDLKNVPRKICVNLWNLWDKKTIKREHNVPISSDHHHQMSCHNQTSRDQYFQR